MNTSQRITDWLHERRIHRLLNDWVASRDNHSPLDIQRFKWQAFASAVAKRSPGQVERMERARGLR